MIPYTLRNEQAKAVELTKDYAQLHENGEFLWNAKPRFGKTLSTYDFCKQIDAKTVLIVTNRPAIANSWYSDYEQFFSPDSGYYFVSNTSSLQGKKYVLSREQFTTMLTTSTKDDIRCIEFVSLQDLKGSIYFGGKFKKHEEVANITWDVLVIDEAHEGVDTYKTDVAFDHIKRKFTLHLSGTPFKALANDKFREEAIYNWTYADEQKAKQEWNSNDGSPNPYATLPKLNLFTYQMSEIIKDELQQGIEIDGETEEYAFDLNEFFETKDGKFVHDSAVDKFLDALTSQKKFPFSTKELRNELKHTMWLLNRVDSAKALAKKLQEHPLFKDEYHIILAAGDGRMSDEDAAEDSFKKVTAAIQKYQKTITLSVGQLTTGVTIPEWSAVLMLSNIKSPALYMQAAFRAQNPCLFNDHGNFYRKENAYVFDFDPARTLTIFEEFANDLSSDTSDGRGDTDTRKRHVRELLNFFPVIGEDEEGEMIELDAEKVLSIPRKIRSQEVVRRGFMSNYLSQNISNIFSAPQEVIDIIKSFTPVEDTKGKVEVTPSTADELSIGDNGEVTLDNDYVIGRSADVFGDKIYEDIGTQFVEAVNTELEQQTEKKKDDELERLQDAFHKQVVKPIIEAAKEEYTGGWKPSDQKRMERKLNEDGDKAIGRVFGDFNIQRNTLQHEKEQVLQSTPVRDRQAVQAEFERREQEIVDDYIQTLQNTYQEFIKNATEDVVRTVETQQKEQKKNTIEDSIRDHLRGFSRTIPSFLMAYGTEETTLANFDVL